MIGDDAAQALADQQVVERRPLDATAGSDLDPDACLRVHPVRGVDHLRHREV
jgi:hypothetical protein